MPRPLKGKGRRISRARVTRVRMIRDNHHLRGWHPKRWRRNHACTKGDKRPYLHDPNNKYSGPKPKVLAKKEEASSSAGAAQVIAGAAFASSIKGAKAQTQSRGRFGTQRNGVQNLPKIKRGFQRLACLKKQRKHSQLLSHVATHCTLGKRARFWGHFAVKFQAWLVQLQVPMKPMTIHGHRGRNLISNKGLPNDLKPFLDDAPEEVNFATGGGKRVSFKAIKLQGSLFGTNVFYTLKDCPAALSLGMQVNENHNQRPFVWLPDQLPFLIKADRVQVTFHCPESAKIFADLVVENVQNLSESVVGVAMQAKVENVPLAPGESSSGGVQVDLRFSSTNTCISAFYSRPIRFATE